MDILSSALIGTASKSLAVEATESAITSAAASAEHTSKDISEKIIHISAFEMELAVAAVLTAETSKTTEALPGSLRVLIKCCMAELVVHLLLLRISQYIISLIYLFKHLLCPGISLVRIRMIFLCKFPVCFFNC